MGITVALLSKLHFNKSHLDLAFYVLDSETSVAQCWSLCQEHHSGICTTRRT